MPYTRVVYICSAEHAMTLKTHRFEDFMWRFQHNELFTVIGKNKKIKIYGKIKKIKRKQHTYTSRETFGLSAGNDVAVFGR